MKLTPRLPCISLLFMLVNAWLMASCGGGGGGGSSAAAPVAPPAPSVIISGTVASGSALTGSVSVYDSSGSAQPRLQNSAIGAAGAYSVNVNGFTAPFLLQATGQVGGQGPTVTLYSVATGAGTVNLTPITTLMVLNMAAGNFQPLLTGASGGLPGLTATNLNTQNTNMDNLLSAVLPLLGLSASYDFWSTSFTVASNGYDELLDNVALNSDSSAAVTVTNITAAATSVTIDTNSGSPNGTFNITSGPATLPVGTLGSTRFAYVSNSGGTISAYSINSVTGALTPLSPATITVVVGATTPSGVLNQIAVDPSGRFLYVVGEYTNLGTVGGAVYGFTISAIDGSLTPVTGSPFPAGNSPVSIEFDATGAYLYSLNAGDGTVSGYSLDASTGALTQLPNSPFSAGGQLGFFVRAGNYLYVDYYYANSINAFSMAAGTGELNYGVFGAPFATGTGPSSLVSDSSGAVLYTSNVDNSGNTSLSAFTINSSNGVLTAVAGNPLSIATSGSMAIDPRGKFLFLTYYLTGVEVYPINLATGVLGTAVAGSPFATSTSQSSANPGSVTVDPTGRFVYVANAGGSSLSGGPSSGGGIAEFTLNSTTGVLTSVAGSPVQAGANPFYIAIK